MLPCRSLIDPAPCGRHGSEPAIGANANAKAHAAHANAHAAAARQLALPAAAAPSAATNIKASASPSSRIPSAAMPVSHPPQHAPAAAAACAAPHAPQNTHRATTAQISTPTPAAGFREKIANYTFSTHKSNHAVPAHELTNPAPAAKFPSAQEKPRMDITEHTRARAEAMAAQAMEKAFAEFEAEYGKAAAKGHKVVAAQAEAKLAERWGICLRMALICLEATDAALANYAADRAADAQG